MADGTAASLEGSSGFYIMLGMIVVSVMMISMVIFACGDSTNGDDEPHGGGGCGGGACGGCGGGCGG